MEEIRNLNDLIIGELVMITRCFCHPEFCIIESLEPITDPKNQLVFSNERRNKIVEENPHSKLLMRELDKNSSSWDMTIPTKAEYSFVSINDSDFEFTIHRCTFAQARQILRNKKRRTLYHVQKKYKKDRAEALNKYASISQQISNEIKKQKQIQKT